MPNRARALKRPAKAVLLAPHSNEHHAVATPIQEVAKRLRKEGVQVETRMRKGMMERAWEVRKFVSDHAKDCSNHTLLSSILSMEDVFLRLSEISNAFLEGPRDTMVAEFHAMDKRVLSAATLFLDEQHFERLQDANVLKCRSPVLAFSESLEFGRGAVEDAAEHIIEEQKPRYLESLEKFSGLLSRHLGLDLRELCSQISTILKALSWKKGQIKLFEFPSTSRPIPREHPMHSYYYTSMGKVRPTSRFEEVYASVIRYSVGSTFRDIDAVLNEFQLD